MLHGGPWARDEWGYNALAQFFANRGYAVLMPNFRGSTGYGKKFLNAGNGEWGAKMQDDLTWGVKYLVAEGIADPKRIGILGGSYGGYATLAGVAFTPDLYRAAVDIVGPSNLAHAARMRFRPIGKPAAKSCTRAWPIPKRPPARSGWRNGRRSIPPAKIKTPLMVVQGANDPRVNRREAEQIVIALRDRGFPVEYLLRARRRPRLRAAGEQSRDVHGGGKIPGACIWKAAIRKAGRPKWRRACRKSRWIRRRL